MQSKKKSIKYIILHMGYAESGAISPLVLKNETDLFLPKKEALANLATALFEKYIFDNAHKLNKTEYPRECCRKSSKKDANFCPKCGNRIVNDDFVPIHEYRMWLYNLYTSNSDTSGTPISGWDPWTLVLSIIRADREEIVEIPEAAEDYMIKFLNPESVPERFKSSVASWNRELALCGEDPEELLSQLLEE